MLDCDPNPRARSGLPSLNAKSEELHRRKKHTFQARPSINCQKLSACEKRRCIWRNPSKRQLPDEDQLQKTTLNVIFDRPSDTSRARA